MKIAQIVCVYPPYRGGIGIVAKEFANLMVLSGHEVVTFTPDYGKNTDNNGGGVVRLKTFLKYGNAACLPQFFWLLNDFDLIYFNYPFFGTQEILWFVLKFFYPRKKIIVRYHMDLAGRGIIFRIFSLPFKIISSSFWKRADLIITASLDYIKNGDLSKFYQKYPEKFCEIPFGVDTKKFRPAFKTETGFKMLFVGGLDRAHYFKGVNVLLEAVAKIKNLFRPEGADCETKRNGTGCVNNWELNIIGSGDLENNYKNKAAELGIAGKVNFLGEVSDKELSKRYREADCLILPSVNRGEAFGIVLIEAMASGLPVIASDLPGVRGVFTPESGLKIRSGDAGDLAEKIKYLMDNPKVCKKMGEEARKLAKKKYGKNTIKEKLIGVLVD